MASKPTTPRDAAVYRPAEGRRPNGRPVMQPAELKRFGPGKPGEADDDDVDSLGIGSVSIVDIEAILDDDGPTDEMPMIDEDKTFI